MKNLVHVLDDDGVFLTAATIEGLEYIQGYYGYFTSLVLRTTDGRKIQGYRYLIRPAVPLLEYNHVD